MMFPFLLITVFYEVNNFIFGLIKNQMESASGQGVFSLVLNSINLALLLAMISQMVKSKLTYLSSIAVDSFYHDILLRISLLTIRIHTSISQLQFHSDLIAMALQITILIIFIQPQGKEQWRIKNCAPLSLELVAFLIINIFYQNQEQLNDSPLKSPKNTINLFINISYLIFIFKYFDRQNFENSRQKDSLKIENPDKNHVSDSMAQLNINKNDEKVGIDIFVKQYDQKGMDNQENLNQNQKALKQRNHSEITFSNVQIRETRFEQIKETKIYRNLTVVNKNQEQQNQMNNFSKERERSESEFIFRKSTQLMKTFSDRDVEQQYNQDIIYQYIDNCEFGMMILNSEKEILYKNSKISDFFFELEEKGEKAEFFQYINLFSPQQNSCFENISDDLNQQPGHLGKSQLITQTQLETSSCRKKSFDLMTIKENQNATISSQVIFPEIQDEEISLDYHLSQGIQKALQQKKIAMIFQRQSQQVGKQAFSNKQIPVLYSDRQRCNYRNMTFDLKITYFEISTLQETKLNIVIKVRDITEECKFFGNQEISDFQEKMYNSFSHELRTPLNASISMLQQSMLSKDVPNKVKQLILTPALNNNILLYSQINDFLALSAFEQDTLNFHFENFNLCDLLDEVCHLFEFSAQQKKIEFKQIIMEGLPIKFRSDYQKIKQILINILANAIQFTKKGSIKVWVEPVPNQSVEDVIAVRIEDTGIGMDGELITQLQNFNTEISSQFIQQTKGIGIGLKITHILAKGLNQNYQGLQICSQKGVGSSFICQLTNFNQNMEGGEMVRYEFMEQKMIRMIWSTIQREKKSSPIKNKSSIEIMSPLDLNKQEQLKFQNMQDDVQEEQEEDLKFNIQETFSDFFKQIPNTFDFNFVRSEINTDLKYHETMLNSVSKENELNCSCSEILIVDDNEFNVYSLSYLIESLGMKSEFSLSGEEAINQIENKIKDRCTCNVNLKLILMDIDMPGMDGFQTTQLINEFYLNKNLQYRPIICCCTAYEDQNFRKKAQSLGMEIYLTKPVEVQNLEQIIQKIKL